MIRLGYLSEKKEYRLDDENLKRLTHINISFGKVIDTNGTVGFSPVNESKLCKLIEENPQIHFALAIGGWTAGNFSEAASTVENRANFVKTSLELMNKYNLKGIDIDWEYPGNNDAGISSSDADKQNFTLLMKDLRLALDEQSRKNDEHLSLTFAAGANEKLVNNIENEKLSKICDFMNLMTYDMGGSFGISGHHASLYESELCENKGAAYFVDLYDKAGFPKEQIVMGAAFYGRGGNGVAGINKQYHGEQGLYFDYHQILDLIASKKTTVYIDDKAKAAFTFDGDTFITFETKESIASKVEYCIENNLAGIMFWEYATDPSGQLLDVLVNHHR